MAPDPSEPHPLTNPLTVEEQGPFGVETCDASSWATSQRRRQRLSPSAASLNSPSTSSVRERPYRGSLGTTVRREPTSHTGCGSFREFDVSSTLKLTQFMEACVLGYGMCACTCVRLRVWVGVGDGGESVREHYPRPYEL